MKNSTKEKKVILFDQLFELSKELRTAVSFLPSCDYRTAVANTKLNAFLVKLEENKDTIKNYEVTIQIVTGYLPEEEDNAPILKDQTIFVSAENKTFAKQKAVNQRGNSFPVYHVSAEEIDS